MLRYVADQVFSVSVGESVHMDNISSTQQTDHARARILPDKGVPQDLGEFTGSEWSVDLVPTKSPDALLEQKNGVIDLLSSL